MSEKTTKDEHNQNNNLKVQIPKSPSNQKPSNRINQEHFIKERDRIPSQSSQDMPLSLSTDIIRMSGPLLAADHGTSHLNSDIKIQKIQNAQFVTVKIPEIDPGQPASPTFFVDQNNAFIQEPLPQQHHYQLHNQHHHHNQQKYISSNQQENNQRQNEEQKELTPKQYLQQQLQNLQQQDIQKKLQPPSSTPPRQISRKVSSKDLTNQQNKESEKVISKSEQEQDAASKYIQQQCKQKMNVFKDVILLQKEKVIQEQKKQENSKIKESPVKTPKKSEFKSPKQLFEQGQDGQVQININKIIIPQKKDISQNIFQIDSPWRAEQAKIMAQYQQSPAILLKRKEQSRSKSPLQNQKESPLVQKKSNEQEQKSPLQQKKQLIEQKSPLQQKNQIEPKSPNQQRKQGNEHKSPFEQQPKGSKAPNLSKDVIVVVHKRAITPELNKVYNNKQMKNDVIKESRNEQLEMIKRLMQEKKIKEGQEQQQKQYQGEQQVQMQGQIRDSNNKWDIKEKEVLMKLVEVYGQNEWNQISKHIPNRTPDSCKDMFNKLNLL